MRKILLLISTAVILASCHSSKKAATEDPAASTKPITTVTQPQQTTVTSPKATINSTETNLCSKIQATIGMGSQSVTTSGSLKMRRDDVIQISLVDPLLGVMEIARIELSTDSLLIIDRYNKRYVKESYKNLPRINGEQIDFQSIQVMFWNEALRPDNDHLSYSFKAKQTIKLDLKLNGIKHNSDWDAHTDVSKKYTKVDAETLFKSIMNL